jgi:hypothetical protein
VTLGEVCGGNVALEEVCGVKVSLG